jgi:hypothetical protein
VLPGESSCGSLDLDLRTEATDPRSWRSGICTDVADRGVIGLFRSRLAGGGDGVDGAWPAGKISSYAPPRVISLC